MKAERARLARLKRLERIREVARQAALAEAARAEGTLAQLLALAERTDAMHTDYAPRPGPSDGHALAARNAFHEGLGQIAGSTRTDAGHARAIADTRAQEAALAERRRVAVEDRAREVARTIDRKAQGALPSGARKRLGTHLE